MADHPPRVGERCGGYCGMPNEQPQGVGGCVGHLEDE